MTHFARNVTTRLSWLGLTQADLAKALGVGPASLSGTLHSLRRGPRRASITRIAAALGLEPDDLLAEEAHPRLLEPHPGMALSDATDVKITAMRARLPDGPPDGPTGRPGSTTKELRAGSGEPR